MPSPFPGMDPYLEDPDIWSDFHGGMVYTIRKYVRRDLPPPYVARVDRHVWVDDADGEERTLLGRPDTYVADPTSGDTGTGVAVATISAPATVELPLVRRERDRFVRIVDQRDRRVVTVIELLSPANKAAGPDRAAYLAKRNEYFAAGVNLVEIDLLRGGTRMPLGSPQAGDYYVLVARPPSYPRAGIWPIALRDPLPTVPVPLDPGIADVRLDLQTCLSDAYDDGFGESDIDYTLPTSPALRGADAVWATERVAIRQRAAE